MKLLGVSNAAEITLSLRASSNSQWWLGEEVSFLFLREGSSLKPIYVPSLVPFKQEWKDIERI